MRFVTVYSDVLSSTSNGWSEADLPRDPGSGDPTDPANLLVDTGVYVYDITITDLANRTYITSAIVNVDVDGPNLSVTNPPDGATILGNAYTINGTSADVGTAGVNRVEYSWDGFGTAAIVANGTASWDDSVDLLALGEGAHALSLRSVDNAGNAGTTLVRNITVDQSAPTITETTVGPGSVFVIGAFTMDGNVADTNALSTLVATQNGVTIENQDLSSGGTSQVLSIPDLPRDPGDPPTLLVADGVFTYIGLPE